MRTDERYIEVDNGHSRTRVRVLFRCGVDAFGAPEHDTEHEWFDYGVAVARALKGSFRFDSDYWALLPGIVALAATSVTDNAEMEAVMAEPPAGEDERRLRDAVKAFAAAAEAVCEEFRRSA